MIRAWFISAPWRPAALNFIGAGRPSWPRHRLGRRTASTRPEVTGVDRVFLRSVPLATPVTADQTLNVTVAQMTLAPRFELLWQNFNKVAAAMTARYHSVAVPVLIAEATTQRETKARETLIARTERVFVSRHLAKPTLPDAERTPALASDRTVATPRVFAPMGRPSRGQSVKDHITGKRHRLGAAQIPVDADKPRPLFRGGQMQFVTGRLQNNAHTVDSRCAALRRTTVARRVHRVLSGQDMADPKPIRSEASAELHYAAPHADQTRTAASAQDATFTPDSSHNTTPPERRFRVDPKPAPPVAPVPKTQAKSALPQNSPEIDVTKLERVMWQRFEKRLRIEQERKGRT